MHIFAHINYLYVNVVVEKTVTFSVFASLYYYML